MIAQDLDQAQFVAESLQKMLEDRERVLNEEFSNADMSNQLICKYKHGREYKMKIIGLVTAIN